jgi:hypothetical protein
MPASSALRKPPKPIETTREQPKERAAARPQKQAKPRLYHARMVVTRVEEWCVEAETPKEARMLLASGAGHRCTPGESIQVELERLIDE